MKLAISIIIIIVLLSGVLYFSSTRDNPENHSPDTKISSQAEPTKNDTQNIAGRYIDYSPEELAITKGIKILFFHASWCSTCQALEQNIRAGRVPDGVTIFSVDFDTDETIRDKYGVRVQHTLIQVDDNGKEIKQWYGSYTIDQIMDQIIY